MLPLGIFSLCTFYLNFFVLRTCFYIFKEMSFKKEVGSNFLENSNVSFILKVVYDFNFFDFHVDRFEFISTISVDTNFLLLFSKKNKKYF